MTDITVVMATYRQRKYLREALSSIAGEFPSQPFEGFNLRVVWVWKDMKNSNDVILDWRQGTVGRASRWDSMSSAEKDSLVDSQFQWIHSNSVQKPNLWRQRQEGLNRTYDHYCRPHDDYISFFDSDDVMLPGWLDRGLKVAEEISSRGKIPIVGYSYRMVDEKLRPIQDVILPEFSMDLMMNGCIIPDGSITTTEALRSVGGYFDPEYDPGHPYYGYAMFLRLLKKYGNEVEVKLLPDIGVLYRQHKKAMHHRFAKTKKKSQENVRRQQEIAKHYFPEGG